MRIDKIKFKCAMAIADVNYGQLSEVCGLSRTYIYNIREGKLCPEEVAKKFAKALNTTVEAITEG